MTAVSSSGAMYDWPLGKGPSSLAHPSLISPALHIYICLALWVLACDPCCTTCPITERINSRARDRTLFASQRLFPWTKLFYFRVYSVGQWWEASLGSVDHNLLFPNGNSLCSWCWSTLFLIGILFLLVPLVGKRVLPIAVCRMQVLAINVVFPCA